MLYGNDALGALIGATILSVRGMEDCSECVVLDTDRGQFWMQHVQDCCEDVRLEDVCGDVDGLVGEVILNAYCSQNHEDDEAFLSRTWSFYTLVTRKATIVLRWLGESNGYYSEEVSTYFKEA